MILPKLNDPTVSVVICSYNYDRFVAAAIDSALAQTLACEVVVVDDGSTDGSRQVIEGYGSRVKQVFQSNAGQLSAYNAGLAHCSGDIVLFLDCDDMLEPTAAAVLATAFDEGVVKAHFLMSIVDDTGALSGATLPATLAHGNVMPAMSRHGVLYPSPPGSGNAYRRTVLEQLFPMPLDAGDFVGADFFTIYGVVAFGQVAAIRQPLGRYRIHGQAVGATKSGNESSPQLTFGNVALAHDESARVLRRYQRLRAWLNARTKGSVVLPEHFLDFSFEKTVYASDVLSAPYLKAFASARQSLTRMLRALWLQPEYTLPKRVGLTIWALLVLVAPRSAGLRIARYVCNPASRT